jgi:hypothetical protein
MVANANDHGVSLALVPLKEITVITITNGGDSAASATNGAWMQEHCHCGLQRYVLAEVKVIADLDGP